jgi:hypothetical protein
MCLFEPLNDEILQIRITKILLSKHLFNNPKKMSLNDKFEALTKISGHIFTKTA